MQILHDRNISYVKYNLTLSNKINRSLKNLLGKQTGCYLYLYNYFFLQAPLNTIPQEVYYSDFNRIFNKKYTRK